MEEKGIEAYLDKPDGRPDLFEAEEGWYHFPCCACVHKKEDPEITNWDCKKCRHYVI